MASERPTNMTRVLAAAHRLALERGARKMTIAEIATTAGVGKGTVYLYWASKEELLVSLMAEESSRLLHQLTERLRRESDCVRPSTLACLVLEGHRTSPLVQALARDPLIVRMFTEGTVAEPVSRASSPLAICDALLPVLRRHGLVRADVDLEILAYGLHCLVAGEMSHVHAPELTAGTSAAQRERLFSSSVEVLLGQRDQTKAHLAHAAHDVADVLDAWAEELSDHLQPPRAC